MSKISKDLYDKIWNILSEKQQAEPAPVMTPEESKKYHEELAKQEAERKAIDPLYRTPVEIDAERRREFGGYEEDEYGHIVKVRELEKRRMLNRDIDYEMRRNQERYNQERRNQEMLNSHINRLMNPLKKTFTPEGRRPQPEPQPKATQPPISREPLPPSFDINDLDEKDTEEILRPQPQSVPSPTPVPPPEPKPQSNWSEEKAKRLKPKTPEAQPKSESTSDNSIETKTKLKESIANLIRSKFNISK